MKKITLFYADDDVDDLMFFEEAVTSIRENDQDSVELYLLKNGINLIDTIEKNKQKNSVVFLDLNMPLKSGFELLEEIRSKPEIHNTPIIMYSTSSDQKDISLSQKLGANYYAVKPNNFKELLDIVSNAIKFNWKNHSVDLNNFIFNKIPFNT